MCGKSKTLTENERHIFAEKIVTWAMKYAVSSQQKDSIIDHINENKFEIHNNWYQITV
jgi:ribonuclease HII